MAAGASQPPRSVSQLLVSSATMSCAKAGGHLHAACFPAQLGNPDRSKAAAGIAKSTRSLLFGTFAAQRDAVSCLVFSLPRLADQEHIGLGLLGRQVEASEQSGRRHMQQAYKLGRHLEAPGEAALPAHAAGTQT
jgi:hypothetical protein